jgi:hypothetical protein
MENKTAKEDWLPVTATNLFVNERSAYINQFCNRQYFFAPQVCALFAIAHCLLPYRYAGF